MGFKSTFFLLLVLLLASGTLMAQATQPVKFSAPFSFVVGDQVMPPGDYVVSVPASTGVLCILSKDGKHSAFVNSAAVESLETADKFKLIYHRYGEQYFISEVWVPGYPTGRIIIPNGSEIEKHEAPEHVVLYARLEK